MNNKMNKFKNSINDCIHMFSEMDKLSIIKCVFNEVITFILLNILLVLIYFVLHYAIYYFLKIIPYSKITEPINTIIDIIYIVFGFICNINVVYRMFKIKYLDRYNYIYDDISIIKNDKSNLTKSIKEYISFIFMFFIIFILIVLFIFIICFASLYIFSYLIILIDLKYISFVVLFITLIFIINLILIIIYFIFKKEVSDKIIIILSSISSVLFIIIGSSMMLISSLNYNFINDSSKLMDTNTFRFSMKEGLVIMNPTDSNIKYVEENIDDIKVELELMKNNNSYIITYETNDNVVNFRYKYNSTISMFKYVIKGFNDSNLINIENEFKSITIYANKNNIEALKKNIDTYNK